MKLTNEKLIVSKGLQSMHKIVVLIYFGIRLIDLVVFIVIVSLIDQTITHLEKQEHSATV